MKKTLIYIIVAAALITVMAIRLKTNKETTENRVYQYDKEQAINVQAITLKREGMKNDISYSGTFEPNKETKVSADIQGKISSVLVDVGSTVRKGQALLQLDNSILKLQLQSIEIQIDGLEIDVQRYKVLTDADAIQGVQLEKTELALKSANVQKATLEEQISKTTVTAPFSGIVTAKPTEVGAFAAPGVPLLQLTDISSLKFTVNVPEKELSQFKINQSYTVTADAYPEMELSGKMVMAGSKANMGNSFPVQFTVSNTSDLKIKSGMFGNVRLENDGGEKSIIIPASAIVGTNIKPQVYLVENNRAVLRDITTSKRFQNKVEISDGLNEGDVLITNGFINLFNGANVTISK